MLDERMLDMTSEDEMTNLPFIERLSHAVAYFCVFQPGDPFSGSVPAVVMHWLDDLGTCWRFAYVVDAEPFEFPGDGDAVFRAYLEEQRAAGRLHDLEAEIPEKIVELFRARRKRYVTTGTPLLCLEETINRDEMDDIFRSTEELALLTFESETVPECVDGECFRVLFRLPDGTMRDLCWLDSRKGERLGILCHSLLKRAWERSRIATDSKQPTQNNE